MTTSLRITSIDRAHEAGLVVGAVFLFCCALGILAVRSWSLKRNQGNLLTNVVTVLALGYAYLAYGQVASAVEEALLARFVESGFICILPGAIARFVVPGAAVALAWGVLAKRRTKAAAN